MPDRGSASIRRIRELADSPLNMSRIGYSRAGRDEMHQRIGLPDAAYSADGADIAPCY
jgi:hypothetical protein